MGGTAPTPYTDGHTEQDRRAAVLAALAIPTSAIPVCPRSSYEIDISILTFNKAVVFDNSTLTIYGKLLFHRFL